MLVVLRFFLMYLGDGVKATKGIVSILGTSDSRSFLALALGRDRIERFRGKGL